MNVTLHVTNAYHATSGGVNTFYRALMAYANAHGRPMRLLVPSEESRVEAVGAHALIYHVRARRSPVADRRYRVLWPIRNDVFEIVRAEQPDLIEVSDKYTLPLLPAFLRNNWVRGVKRPVLVATSHERMDDTTKAYFGAPTLWRAVSRLFLRKYYFPMVDAHIANSFYTAGELDPASKGHRLHRDVHVLPMGVDASKFKPEARTAESRRALAGRASIPAACARMLLYAGRLGAEKNLPMLVRMMDCLPPKYFLILAGDGPLAPLLRQVGESRRIRLLGHVPRNEVAALYAGADAFVHPNPREPFGIAPLEAMAAGLPLVAPNAGGVLSYASPENAWLADATAEAFADAVMRLFNDPAEACSRTARARRTAEQHDWPLTAARYFALYDEMIVNTPRC